MQRLQKVMAQAGLGSRRQCEEIIRQGRVKVDGKIAELGLKIDPNRAQVVVDSQALPRPEALLYIALHKPRGVLSVSQDDRGRKTVRDMVPLPGHLYPVGRLDALSEGLILLTNDGELANRLTHPRYEHEKEYEVLVKGDPPQAVLEKWQRGVYFDGERTTPANVRRLGPNPQRRGTVWLRVVLRQGRKRQIRRVAAILGYPVQRLIRKRIGPIQLSNLQVGSWRHLTPQEIKTLQTVKKRSARRKRRSGKRHR